MMDNTQVDNLVLKDKEIALLIDRVHQHNQQLIFYLNLINPSTKYTDNVAELLKQQLIDLINQCQTKSELLDNYKTTVDQLNDQLINSNFVIYNKDKEIKEKDQMIENLQLEINYIKKYKLKLTSFLCHDNTC